ncbi:MAG: hypothetical protein V3T58_02225 [Candidatus Hydrothermarchaeales archaeon]
MKVLTGPHREPMTTITIGTRTAETIRRLVGKMQLRTGKTVTQRMVVDAALEAYTKKLKEDEK